MNGIFSRSFIENEEIRTIIKWIIVDYYENKEGTPSKDYRTWRFLFFGVTDDLEGNRRPKTVVRTWEITYKKHGGVTRSGRRRDQKSRLINTPCKVTVYGCSL